jgi:hypothetical protein
MSSMDYKTSPEQLAGVLSASVTAQLEKAIKEELMKVAEPIVAQVARTMAKNIRGKVMSYSNVACGGVQIAIILDGVKDCAFRDKQ